MTLCHVKDNAILGQDSAALNVLEDEEVTFLEQLRWQIEEILSQQTETRS